MLPLTRKVRYFLAKLTFVNMEIVAIEYHRLVLIIGIKQIVANNFKYDVISLVFRCAVYSKRRERKLPVFYL